MYNNTYYDSLTATKSFNIKNNFFESNPNQILLINESHCTEDYNSTNFYKSSLSLVGHKSSTPIQNSSLVYDQYCSVQKWGSRPLRASRKWAVPLPCALHLIAHKFIQ